MIDYSDEQRKEFTQNLLDNFIDMSDKGDPDAGFLLAELFLRNSPTDSVKMLVAVFEVLMQQSVRLGSEKASEYMLDTWPKMKPQVIRRLVNRGLKAD